MNKQILYISFDGLSDPLGQSQIIPYLIGIAQAGYSITILTCEKAERIQKLKSEIQNQLFKYNISWEFILYDESGGFSSRLSYIRSISKKAIQLHKLKNFKLLHCRSYLSAMVALGLKKKYHIPFLFDMRGFWADERKDGNIWKMNNPLHFLAFHFFKRKEKQFLKNADGIISLTQKAKDYLIKTYDGFSIEKKISVIPCCVDLQLFDPQIFPEKTQKFNLVYSGSIGTWYFTNEMIDCFLVMKSVIPDLTLTIITRDIAEIQTLLMNYSGEQKSSIRVESCSYKEMPQKLHGADASIFFIKPVFSKMASSPTKMAECWAMNIPVLTNAGIGDSDLYFKDTNAGSLISAFTKEKYIQMANDLINILSSSPQPRLIAQKHFNKEDGIKEYVKQYKRICGEDY